MTNRRVYKPTVDVPLPEAVPELFPGDCCKVCGCPSNRMPMVNRGTGWCSEKHRKELEESDGPRR